MLAFSVNRPLTFTLTAPSSKSVCSAGSDEVRVKQPAFRSSHGLRDVSSQILTQGAPVARRVRVYSEEERYPQTNTAYRPGDETLPFSRADWAQMYCTMEEEWDLEITDEMIEGEIPRDLIGTMFRNVPGGLHAGKSVFAHYFDGDGMICKVSFREGGKVTWKNRYVRTEEFLEERKAKRILFRNVFGTQREGGWRENLGDLGAKNVANTNVLYWGGKLLALWEGGLPYELESSTLKTTGLESFGGKFKKGMPFCTGLKIFDKLMGFGDSLTAHPRIHNDRLIVFNYLPTASGMTRLRVYELDERWNFLAEKHALLPRFSFIHDFCVTDNYYVFVVNPLKFSPLLALAGLKTTGECISFDSMTSTKIYLFDRKSKGEYLREKIVECGSWFSFHHVNAHENSDGTLDLSTVRLGGYPGYELLEDGILNVDFNKYPTTHIYTYRIDPKTESVISCRKMSEGNVEMPVINPKYTGKRSRFCWISESVLDPRERPGKNVKSFPLQGYARYDLKTGDVQRWFPGSRCFANELTFAQKEHGTEEDDGYVIGFIYDSGRRNGKGNDIVILDAKNLEQGPLATIHLPFGVPPGLHTEWVPNVL